MQCTLSLFSDARENAVAVVTAAGFAVGRLIVELLIEHGVFPIQLVRSEAGAAALAKVFPGSPVFATETRSLSASLLSRRAFSMSPVTTGLLELPKRSLMLASRARSAPRCSTSPKKGKENENRNDRSRRSRPGVCARSNRTRA
jgi:hypothetical protein